MVKMTCSACWDCRICWGISGGISGGISRLSYEAAYCVCTCSRLLLLSNLGKDRVGDEMIEGRSRAVLLFLAFASMRNLSRL